MNNTASNRTGFNNFGKRKSRSTSPQEVSVNTDSTFTSAITLFISMMIFVVGLMYYSLPVSGWQEAITIIPALFMGIVALVSAFLCRGGRAALGARYLILSFLLGTFFMVLAIDSNGLIFGLSAFLITTSIASQALPIKQARLTSIISGLVGVAIFLLDMYGPIWRQLASPTVNSFLMIATSVLILIFIFLMIGRSQFYSLRTRLVTAFIFVSLLPTAILAILNYRSTQMALVNATNQALSAAAAQTASSIDTFIASTANTVQGEAQSPELVEYLELPRDQQPNSPEENAVMANLRALVVKDFARVYYLLNREGTVLLSTSTSQPSSDSPYLGVDKVDPYFKSSILLVGSPYSSPIIFSGSETGPNPDMYFASRIENAEGSPIGILMARYDPIVLQNLIAKSINLAGPGSFPILFDENTLRIADSVSPDEMYTVLTLPNNVQLETFQSIGRLPVLPAETLLVDEPDLASGLNEANSEQPYFNAKTTATKDALESAAVQQIENMPWRVVYLQPQSIILAPLQEQTRNTLYLVVAITATTLVIAFVLSRYLTGPITGLTHVAERVAAGDLSVQASETNDELGLLAKTFNTMTSELRNTLEELEGRVAIRTAELARASEQSKKRANQLQAVAEVAHAIASVQDPEQLLTLVTRLISERFGFYHVGIFLLDSVKEYAVLQAANSEGGARMLDRGHKLKVGQVGIVGFVTGRGEPRIALDVGKDAVFFDNPDLPYTRSEMALPLKIGDRVIGALDVQSMEQSAFNEEDVELLSTLADQVAIAIENTRLFSETRSALVELQTLHRQYLQQEWSKVVAESGKSGYQYQHGKLLPLPTESESEVWSTIENNESSVTHPPAGEISPGESAPDSTLVLPISVRGQVIGRLNLGKPEFTNAWNEDDINLVKSVADQIGLAIENARLLEETQSRAEREHQVSEITARLRASNDPQAILQTAVHELRKVLGAKTAQVIIPPNRPATTPQQNIKVGGNGKHVDDNGFSGGEAGDNTGGNVDL